jgi:hypothetical protein
VLRRKRRKEKKERKEKRNRHRSGKAGKIKTVNNIKQKEYFWQKSSKLTSETVMSSAYISVWRPDAYMPL